MARERTIEVCVLNIELPAPHSTRRYEALFSALFELRRPVKVRGDQSLIISSIERDGEFFRGSVGRFLEINVNLPWFDLDTLDKADDNTKSQISIPEALRPNYVVFWYQFSVRAHKFVFETYGKNVSVSPKLVLKFIRHLVRDSAIVRQFGIINVSMIQSNEALEEMLALPTLKSLVIEYRLPNPDDQDFDREMEERLRREHARRLITQLDSDGSGSLVPNRDTKKLARAALNHGHVVARGVDPNGQSVRLSSEDHPFTKRLRYDPDRISEDTAFRRIARGAVTDIGPVE
jgi:hypothetical protein